MEIVIKRHCLLIMFVWKEIYAHSGHPQVTALDGCEKGEKVVITEVINTEKICREFELMTSIIAHNN